MAKPETALAQAEQAYERGARCFKLKIGRPGALERELEAVQHLRRALGPEVRLRLDANQSFSAARAASELPRFASYDIEFVEEPCLRGDVTGGTTVGLPLAFDESLAGLTPSVQALAALGCARPHALILKPTLLGGISACAGWAEVARSVAAEVIVSHVFEGPWGLALCATLALSLGSEASAHGLDVHGARLEASALPGFLNSRLEPWTAPGFGLGNT